MFVEPEKPVDEDVRRKMIEILDEELKEVNEKYFKYRRWGMLSEPEILILKEKSYWDYRESLRAKGVVLNQIKPVTVINSDERENSSSLMLKRKIHLRLMNTTEKSK